jgi:hypothetical protein
MTISQSKRQPSRLLSLADENLLIGINRLAFGSRHLIAFTRIGGAIIVELYNILSGD